MHMMTLEMPVVSHCSAIDCAYNRELGCHARAITIGDGIHPGCDTYFMNTSHVQEKQRIAGIGACKVGQCSYNTDLECGAESITVGRSGGAINCLTFSAG